MAIIHPLRPRMGRRTTICILAGIWVLGLTFSFPNLIFFTTFVQDYPNGEQRIICYSEWPDGPTTHSYIEYVYNVFFMVMTYFLPIGSMCFAYARVGIELWGSQSIGECTQRQLENIKSKRRVVKMMMVVVSIFAVCWLPFHIYFIVTSHMPDIINQPYIQDLYLAIYWLAMSNSMYNPIIYFWMNSRFRRGFKQFFSWCPYVVVPPEGLARREAVTSRYNSCSGSPEAHYRIVRNGQFKQLVSQEVPMRLIWKYQLNVAAYLRETLLYPAETRASPTSAKYYQGAPQPGSLESGMTTISEDYTNCNYASFRSRKRWRANQDPS